MKLTKQLKAIAVIVETDIMTNSKIVAICIKYLKSSDACFSGLVVLEM